MEEEKIIKIIAEALLNSENINYIVRINNSKGLQIETADKKHYNIIMRDLDILGGSLIKIRHETRKR